MMKIGPILLLSLLVLGCDKNSEKPEVDVYGHAGISLHRDRAIFPADSFESIEYAIDVLDADGVEIDIQMTKDSILVLYHDEYIEGFTGLDGCVSNYDYADIKHLTLDRTKYKIVQLATVLEFIQTRDKLVFLDTKIYNFCNSKDIELSSFEYALNQSMININEDFKSKITLGMRQNSFLKLIDHPTKCFESDNVDEAITIAIDNNYKGVLFFSNDIDAESASLLKSTNLYWGIIDIKDKWSVDRAVELRPNFVITDNIAYTKQVTN